VGFVPLGSGSKFPGSMERGESMLEILLAIAFVYISAAIFASSLNNKD
jgi:hypothetical protein